MALWRAVGLSGELPPARSGSGPRAAGGSRGTTQATGTAGPPRKNAREKLLNSCTNPRASVPLPARAQCPRRSPARARHTTSTAPRRPSRDPGPARAPGRTFRPLSSKLRRRLSPTIITNRIKSETEAILRSGREAPDDRSSLRPASASVSAPLRRSWPALPLVSSRRPSQPRPPCAVVFRIVLTLGVQPVLTEAGPVPECRTAGECAHTGTPATKGGGCDGSGCTI